MSNPKEAQEHAVKQWMPFLSPSLFFLSRVCFCFSIHHRPLTILHNEFPLFHQRKLSVFQLVPGAVEEMILPAFFFTPHIEIFCHRKGQTHGRSENALCTLVKVCDSRKSHIERSPQTSLFKKFPHSAEPAAAVFFSLSCPAMKALLHSTL